MEHDEKSNMHTSVEKVSTERMDVGTVSTDVNSRRTVVIHDRSDHRN